MASLLSLSANPPTIRSPPLSLRSSFFKGTVTSLRPNPSPLCLPLRLHHKNRNHLTVFNQASSSTAAVAAPADSGIRFRLNNLAPQPGSRKRAKRKGRGISAGQGGSCGFGMRGQKSRSGPGVKKGFEGGQMPLYRRIPKLRGIAGGSTSGLTLKRTTCSLVVVEEDMADLTEKEEGLRRRLGAEKVTEN